MTPTAPHALVVTRPGGPEVLEVRDQTPPVPQDGQVLVRVAASGVNFIDVYQREGRYPVPTPFVPQMEGAGEVVGTGPGVTSVAVGDRVAWAMHLGSAATYALVPAGSLVPVPDALALDLAAASLIQGMTAHFLTTDTYAVGPDTTALVHAAAGGVGQWLVQLVKAKGGTVIATAGSTPKCQTARELGADVVIDYSSVDDLAGAVREATGGRGVDVAYDGVGAATFDASLASLRPRGTLAIFGAASGPVPPFDVQRLNAGGSLILTRPSLIHFMASGEELRWRAGAVFDAVVDQSVRLSIGGRWALGEARTAYQALEGRTTQGKLLLIP